MYDLNFSSFSLVNMNALFVWAIDNKNWNIIFVHVSFYEYEVSFQIFLN